MFLDRFRFLSYLAIVLVACVGVIAYQPPALAGAIDPYVKRYLRVIEPIPVKIDAQGQTQMFSPESLSNGKRIFEENCKNCHVGGANLPYPAVSLALNVLEGATPPRDNVESLIAYQRMPMSYDGTEETYFCREVTDDWLSDADLGDLSAFILRAAQKAPGWGSDSF